VAECPEVLSPGNRLNFNAIGPEYVALPGTMQTCQIHRSRVGLRAPEQGRFPSVVVRKMCCLPTHGVLFHAAQLCDRQCNTSNDANVSKRSLTDTGHIRCMAWMRAIPLAA